MLVMARLNYRYLFLALTITNAYCSTARLVKAKAEVVTFAHEELRKLEFPNWREVLIVTEQDGCSNASAAGNQGANDCFYAIGDNCIEAPQNTYQKIMLGTEEDRNIIRALIGHESAHLRLKRLESEKAAVGNASRAVYMPSCVSSLYAKYQSRLNEWQADEGVRNEPALLYAISGYFQKQDRIARVTMGKLSYFDAPSCKDEGSTSYFWNLFSTNPTHLARAKRFKERADSLRKT